MRKGLVVGVGILVVTLAAVFLPSKASAQAWLDPAWTQRSTVAVANPGGVGLSNFEVQLSLGSSFNFAGSNADGSDVRVTGNDGTTLIPFWIESWNASTRTASIWINVPTIPSAGTTLYLYYGNPAATTASNGTATFEFFDDFDSTGTAVLGYYQLGLPQTELVQDQAWEATAPHNLSVVEVDSGGYTYWGYYGLQDNCGGVGLARSNDLVTWTKYPSNPLFFNGRWPSVLKVGSTFYMLYTKDYCTTSHIDLAESTDGITFNDVEAIVPAQAGYRNQNPNLFFNPNDGQYYMYWYSGNDTNSFAIHARKAPTPEGLNDPSTETIVLQSSSTLAAPNVLFRDNTYFLSTEVKDASGNWITFIYSSVSPTAGFSLLPGNPIMSNGSACNFQFVFGTQLHDYYCALTGSTWTVNHRAADLTAGRTYVPSLNPSNWTVSGGSWTIVTDMQQDGSTGGVAQGSISSTRGILLSSYTGTDYVLEGYGRLLSGRVWGLGTRATDSNNLYSSNLYDDLNATNNLYEYDWAGGRVLTLSQTAVGEADPDTWYQLLVKVHGSTIEVWKDGVLRINTTSSQYSSGAVALYGEQNTVAEFNNVLVRKYAATEPVLTITPSAVITSLAPSYATAGGPGFTLTVNGSNFANDSVVQWNGSNRTTTFLSSSQLQASISSADIAIAEVAGVAVADPSSSGLSNTVTFNVQGPALQPVVTSLAPSSATAGGPGFTLTVSGSNFVNGSVVQWNGSNRTTTFLSSSQLQASISATDILSTGTVPVTVFSPSPGGGTSNSMSFVISNASPNLVSLAPSSATAGGSGFTLTVNGSNFVNGSVVQWNGSNRTTTFLSNSQLQASISATDISSAETVPVTVFNPSPGGGTSNSMSFVVSPQPGQTGWFDTAWGSRSVVTVTNPGGVTLGNFQVSVTLDSTFDFAAAKSDGSDLRFTLNDGVTLIPFWIESWNSASMTATLWVNIPSIPSAGASLYLYYGNPAAATASNGSTTFDFFDDFSETALDTTRWTVSGGSWTIVTDTQQDGTTGGVAQGSISSTRGILLSSYTGTDYVLEGYGRLLSGRVWGLGTRATDSNNLYSSNLYDDLNTTNNLYEYDWAGGSASTLQAAAVGEIDPNTWYKLSVKVHGTSIEVDKNGVSMLQTSSSQYASGAVALYGEQNTVAEFNNVLVRKYAATEPVATISPSSVVITSLAPSSATAGGSGFTLTVNGSNFVNGSVVQWNGSNRTTTFLSNSQLQASISATDISSAETVPVTVFNPSPGGGTSNSMSFVVSPQPGQTGWFDTAWSSRSVVTVTNPGGVTLGNFQVSVTLDSTFDFAAAKSDGSDLRFTLNDGVTLIPFWIESWNSASMTATLWVNIPSIPSAGASLYLYYGNPAAATASNGSTTFDFFDDFSETALDTTRWTVSGGSWTIVTDTQQDGTTGGVAQGSISSTRGILLSSYTGTDYVLEGYGRLLSGRVWGLGTRATDSNNLYSSNLYDDLNTTNNLYEYDWAGGSASTLQAAAVGEIDPNTWYKLSVKVHGTSIEVDKNGVSMLQTSSSQYASGAVALYGEQNTVAEFNNVLVRKYAATEPVAAVAP